MLVQFMLKNVLSFKDETVLDMTAISAYKEHPSNLIDKGFKEKFLRVAAIYGANASGKSNLCFAVYAFKKIISESFNNISNGESPIIKEYYRPFSFEKNNQENSEFQIIQILGDFEYRYGFEYNAECIVTEWLYRKNLKTNRTSTIFERTTSSVEFGSSVRKEVELFRNQIPPETLVLSFFNKLRLKNDVFQTVYSGIMDTLVVPTNFSENRAILDQFLPEIIDEDKHRLMSFLNAIDVGIIDIDYNHNDGRIEFITLHEGKDMERYKLSLFNESEGTVRSIALFICARIAIMSDSSLFIDEINIKLHPLLLKFIIDLFYEDSASAQLIYTTHDTTLMDKKFFRRDQILFVQKDRFGYSELSALSDFKVRSDASFEKDYLAGVYGGIPFLKDFVMKEGTHGNR